jgi:hypothetical protein
MTNDCWVVFGSWIRAEDLGQLVQQLGFHETCSQLRQFADTMKFCEGFAHQHR